jgi:hypothetical protein
VTIANWKSAETTVLWNGRLVQKRRNVKTDRLEKEFGTGERANVCYIEIEVGLLVEYDDRVAMFSVEIPIEQIQGNFEIGETRTDAQIVDGSSWLVDRPASGQ